MNRFEALGDSTRRRLLEELIDGERPAGDLAAVALEEFGLSQPAVSRHLRVLRDVGLVRVRVDGARRMYALDPEGLRAIDDWLIQFRELWSNALTALGTEIARGQRTGSSDPAERDDKGAIA